MESKTMMHRTLVLVLAVWLMACAATVVGTPSNVHPSLAAIVATPAPSCGPPQRRAASRGSARRGLDMLRGRG